MQELKNYNLLFLEDNLSFAKESINFLSLYFNSIYHLTTIKGAIELFNCEKIHLIISDLKVEDGNALEFIQKIRQKDRVIPIVVLSAHKDEEFLLKAIPLNLTRYLIKPISFEEFTQTLQELSQLLQQLYRENIKLCECVEYNLASKKLFVDNSCVRLSKKEILFLELLIQKEGDCLNKSEIEEYIWENKTMSQAALKNFVLRLRKKLKKDLIYTIPTRGYCLVKEEIKEQA